VFAVVKKNNREKTELFELQSAVFIHENRYRKLVTSRAETNRSTVMPTLKHKDIMTVLFFLCVLTVCVLRTELLNTCVIFSSLPVYDINRK
jgi:hypothetical protein